MAFRKRNICAVVCIAAFLGLLLFTLIGLQSLINDVVLEGVVMAPQNVETWGENPGSTKTVTLRNFTFYNFTNPRGFLYRGQKPRLHEVGNFLLQERFNFTNITYSPDNSYVDFNYWLFFTYLSGSKAFDTPVHVLNLAPISFWSQLENIDIASLAIQGFGGLYTGIVDTLRLQAIGQGVAGQFLATYASFLSFCKNLNINTKKCQFIYNDPLYGLGDPNNYQVWVQFSYYNHTDSEYLLYEYFNFNKVQLDNFDKIFSRWCLAVDSILDNSYCGGNVCSNTYLALLQIGQSGVTRQPPSGQASDSICLTPDGKLTQNISCQGFPEIYSFQHYWFSSINSSDAFKDVQISQQTVYLLYSPHNGTLLNPGNLTRLFRIGQLYDSNKSPQNLKNLISQTHGQSQFHAVIIWEYVKYMAYEFVLQSKDKGTKQIAGLGGVFSQALYQSFVQFGDWIIAQLLSLIVAEKVGQCQPFIQKIIEDITPDRAKQICYQIDAEHYRNYSRLIQPCMNQIFADKFKEQLRLSDYEFSELCNIGQQSIKTIALQAHRILDQKYNCTAIPQENRCSKYELSLKQFINSTLTQNPIQNSIRQYQKSLTGYSWNEQLQEWQYRHFLKEVYGDYKIDHQLYNDYSKMSDLLSFDGLFNGPLVQNLTIMTNQTLFEELFYWKNKTLLMDYIRFITIQVGFGGFIQKRTVNELLFGYQDQFLKTLKEMDPMLGGDPSIQTLVALNQPNSTLKQAQNIPQSMYTGYSDPMITRVYRSNYKKSYVTYNKTYFDGYNIISEQVSPFKKPLKLAGTDAVQFKPLSTPDDRQYVYIDSLYRIGQLTYNQTVTHFDFDALRYTISFETLASSDQYPPNDNYYQYISGFMNLSFLGPPLFASKNHFLGTGQKWASKIQFYDETGKYPQYPNKYDETQLIIEPKSGATFTATIYLQTNLYLKKDILFHNENLMIPVFSLYRSGNMSESIANDLLGDLKFALGLPKKLIILSIVGVIFCAACLIGCNMKKKPVNKSSLLSSTYENEERPGFKEQVEVEEEVEVHQNS